MTLRTRIEQARKLPKGATPDIRFVEFYNGEKYVLSPDMSKVFQSFLDDRNALLLVIGELTDKLETYRDHSVQKLLDREET